MSAISARHVPIPHRTAVTAVDKIVIPTITAAKNNSIVGDLTAAIHTVAIVAGNKYGPAGSSLIVEVTQDTPSKSLDITVPAVIGATYYDVFVSPKSVNANPLHVARVYEAMVRATGARIGTDGVVTAAGGAGKISVKKIGTGITCSDTYFTKNRAYIIPDIDPIPFSGPGTLKLFVNTAIENFGVIPSVKLRIMITPNDTAKIDWYCDEIVILDELRPELKMPIEGNGYIMILIEELVGNTPAIDIIAEVVSP